MKTHLLLTAAFVWAVNGSPSLLFAQDSDSNEAQIQDARTPIFFVRVSQTDSIAINTRTITAIALHTYRLNGDVPVTEVTIDTSGNNTIRFYYIRGTDKPDASTSPGEVVHSLRREGERIVSGEGDSGSPELPSVKFPEGTYAHSIEFQITSPEKLQKFYKTALSVWERRSPNIVRFKF